MCNRNGRGRVFLIDNNWIDYGDIDEVKDIVIPPLFRLLNEIDKFFNGMSIIQIDSLLLGMSTIVNCTFIV